MPINGLVENNKYGQKAPDQGSCPLIRFLDVDIKHCPTTQMLADFFTKPLQGEAFYRFRAAILNLSEDMAAANNSFQHPQECVESGEPKTEIFSKEVEVAGAKSKGIRSPS